MRKRDKLRKKQSKMNIKKCQRKYRKAVQRAIASGTASAYLNLGVLYVGLRSSIELNVVILDYIARRYKYEKRLTGKIFGFTSSVFQ